MIRLIQIALSFVLLLHINVASAQKENSSETTFNNGKELLNLGKYGLAMQAFKPLTSPFEGNKYEKIASFYYAVSAYNTNEKYVARDMFLQILQKYPSWEKMDELYLWLTKIYFDEGDLKGALTYASKIKDQKIINDASALKNAFLKKLDFNQLDSLLQVYPSDKNIASNLADKIVEMPIAEQDRDLLENIVSVYELDKTKYRVEEELKSVKKGKYQVAVLLPFMLNELKLNTKHISNEFVIEIYEGLLTGVADLKNMGINISLHPYDTKKDSTVTSRIMKLEELKHMDLIIGPLYPGPVKVVSEFAFTNKINMINPLSSNYEIIGNNPFSFLFMPSDETTTEKAAEHIASNLENKNVFIFHGTSARDSVLAYAYKEDAEKQGLNVCYMEKVATEDSKRILDILTNTLTVEFDASEFDSLLVDDVIEGNLRITEKDYLVIQPDSIGHVFIASNEPSLVASAITGLETRGDTIMLLGSERWLELRVIDIVALDRLNSQLIAPTFIDKSKPKYEGLNSIYMESFNAYPTKNFYTGYEVMMTCGKLLNKLGNLFQFNSGINDFFPGEIFQGLLYGSKNSNQIVPIIEFKDSELVVANPR